MGIVRGARARTDRCNGYELVWMGIQGKLDRSCRYPVRSLVGLRAHSHSRDLHHSSGSIPARRGSSAGENCQRLRERSNSSIARWFHHLYRHGTLRCAPTNCLRHGESGRWAHQPSHRIRIHVRKCSTKHVDIKYGNSAHDVANRTGSARTKPR